MTVVRGPNNAMIPLLILPIFYPINFCYVLGQIANILPTVKLLTTIELPSNGSKVT